MKITIPGTPVAQGRMRSRILKGFVITYDPNAKEKQCIRETLKTICNDRGNNQTTEVFDGEGYNFPRISFIFYMPIPKSIRKKDVELYNSGKLKHDKKPDIDNLIKLYLDCLDGIIIHGDQKVSLGSCIKLYDKEPRTVISINETRQVLEPWELETEFLHDEARVVRSSFERDCQNG